MSEDTPRHPDPGAYWLHRRLMAYWSLVMLTVTLAAALRGKIDPAAGELVVGLCWIFGTVLVLYYGGNAAQAFADRFGKR